MGKIVGLTKDVIEKRKKAEAEKVKATKADANKKAEAGK